MAHVICLEHICSPRQLAFTSISSHTYRFMYPQTGKHISLWPSGTDMFGLIWWSSDVYIFLTGSSWNPLGKHPEVAQLGQTTHTCLAVWGNSMLVPIVVGLICIPTMVYQVPFCPCLKLTLQGAHCWFLGCSYINCLHYPLKSPQYFIIPSYTDIPRAPGPQSCQSSVALDFPALGSPLKCKSSSPVPGFIWRKFTRFSHL